MPYSNIVFVKLFLSLFEEDDRFLYQLNESQQLLYVKMLYMAGATSNHITKNVRFISNKINYHHEEACFISDIERIKAVFPQFKEEEGFYCFQNFEKLHNFIGSSKGVPSEFQRIAPEKSKRRVREDTTTAVKAEENTKDTAKDLVLTAWNERMPWKVRTITGTRLRHLTNRLKEKDFVDNFHTILTKILESDFLMGRRKSESHPNFKADFDWLIKNDNNYIKILEDKYANRGEL